MLRVFTEGGEGCFETCYETLAVQTALGLLFRFEVIL